MTTRRSTDSRRMEVRPAAPRRAVAAAVRRCAAEALEDRRLFAVGLVSVGLGGAPANGDSSEASVSADGHLVVFTSFASNLVDGDTNNKSDVFLRDTVAGTTTLISRNPTNGEIGNADSIQPVINQDGTYVAFVSRANNLLSGDGTDGNDVFRYNIATHALQLVSAKDAAGTQFPGNASSEPTISKDGNLVSFTTFAGNLGVIDTNKANDVFVRNMGSTTAFAGTPNALAPGANRLVSVATGAAVTTGNGLSFDSWISEDGRYISFRSDASDLVAPGVDANNVRDTYLRDVQTGTTTLVSVNQAGVAANAASDSNSVSGNGRFVSFQSKATDIVGNDGNGDADVFLRDTLTNTTRLLSVNRFGTSSAGGLSEFPAMSQDGGYASFSSYAPDIVAGDANGREDVFVRDLVRGPLTVLSVNAAGKTGNGRSYDPFINRMGTQVVFTSDASNLTTGDTNDKQDIFIASVAQPSGTTDSAAPTATFGQVLAANPDATAVDFTVNLSDDQALNTVSVGNLTVDRTASGTTTAASFPATLVSVVGTGTSAVATYRVTLPSAASANTGSYVVNVPAGAIVDAAGNALAAGVLPAAGGAAGPTFVLSSGGTGTPTDPSNPTGGSTVGDPNGPDLQIVSPGKTPTEVIGGRRGSFKWKVLNAGPGILNSSVTFGVYASADQTFDAGDVQLATFAKTLKKVKVGKAKALSAKFTYPSDLGNGNYYVLVRADTGNAVAESNEANNTGTSVATVLVRQPFVDLQPTSVGKPTKFSAGSAADVTVVVKNNGNVPFKGAVPITVALSTDGLVNDANRTLITATPKIGVGNGKSKSVKVKFTLPTDLAPGTYFVTADVDSTNALAESDEGNNTAVSFGFNSI
ncbi:MAG: hypothetical protein JWO31_1262 [Phycisphaerales bacterium]|nr:hypothetical protein [Phycisphaerales bacterium]